MNRSLWLTALLALTACSSIPLDVISTRPESSVDVEPTYTDPIRGADMAVVIRAFEVRDKRGVDRHIGPPVPGSGTGYIGVYRAFFHEESPPMFDNLDVGEVRLFDAGVGSDPSTMDFGGFSPRLVLVLNSLVVGYGEYGGRDLTSPVGSFPQLRLDSDLVLWDREADALVASGRVESGLNRGPIASRGTYVNAIEEFVEQLARFTPLTRRG